MVTLAASFLTYCKLVANSPNSFNVERPKFVNLYNYPVADLFTNRYSKCPLHDRLGDHSLVSYKICSDARAWSLDPDQQRRHFLDVVNGRITLCGKKLPQRRIEDVDSEDRKPKGEEASRVKRDLILNSPPRILNTATKDFPESPKVEEVSKVKRESEVNSPPKESADTIDILESPKVSIKDDPCKDILDKTLEECQKKEDISSTEPLTTFPQSSSSSDMSEEPKPKESSEKVLDLVEEPKSHGSLDDLSNLFEEPKSKDSLTGVNHPTPQESSIPEKNTDIQELTDDLLKTLDQNIVILETTFDAFIRKNRDFIQNILECLNHEKQKQKALEQSYGKMKHENDVLRTNNEYLKMVNAEQLKLFKNELDKAMSENKAAYNKKVNRLETQIQTLQDKLQTYKLNEVKYKEGIQKGDKKVSRLEDDVQKLKNIEATLLKNYVRILNFLEDVKKQLNSEANKDEANRKPSTFISDKDIDPELKGVMKSALTNGMESLNVRDLSILHDAIQDLNYHLCHTNEIHGFMPSSICNNLYAGEYQDDIMNNAVFQDHDTTSNLSIYPSRQRPHKY